MRKINHISFPNIPFIKELLPVFLFLLLCFSSRGQEIRNRETIFKRGHIIIGDDKNFPPYSYLDENNVPQGFNIDIARAVCKEMGLEVEFRLDNWDKVRRSLETGEIDAIAGMFYSAERNNLYSFSTKHSISTGDIFTGTGTNLFSLGDLRGKVVLVQKADIVGEYLRGLNLNIIIVEVPSVNEALRLLESGLYDYAGVLKVPGMHAIKENKYKNIKAQGLQFMPNEYSMAVKKGNEDLLYILNAGLNIIKANENYKIIHDKWLGVYEEVTLISFIKNNKWALSLVGFVILVLVVTSITLKYLVNKKTRELRILNNSLVHSNNEIKNKNEMLAVSQKELEARIREIEKQGEIIKFKQNFLANMSHEIRTPLTGIMGMIDILGQSQLSEEQHEYINILKHSGENLREIINQVLDYSKIEAGKVQLNIKEFEFNDLLVQARSLFQSLAGDRLVFESRIDSEIPKVIKADKNRLIQMINNLISNGVKFTPEGKIIFRAERIRVNESSGELLMRISITDTGMGITLEKQKVLFRPFAQIHESDQRLNEGTGLGLSICKELAQLHGGEIGVESRYGSGSTFWFTFAGEAAQNAEKEPVNGRQPESAGSSGLKILLAEDKVVNQKVIKLLLNSYGHHVVIAENGEKAVLEYAPGKYDLILMDIQMPVMDGITATAELRNRHIDLPPVVGLSANAFEGDREKYISLGLDEYITKPFNMNDFIEVLERVNLNRHPA